MLSAQSKGPVGDGLAAGLGGILGQGKEWGASSKKKNVSELSVRALEKLVLEINGINVGRKVKRGRC